jgi:hypothetical protein
MESARTDTDDTRAGELLNDGGYCFEKDAVTLLGFEPTNDEDDGVSLIEAQGLPHALRRLTLG